MPHSHPEPFIHHPTSVHKQTLILLHGTSTSGPSFGSELLSFPIPLPISSSLSQATREETASNATTTLPILFPNTKFLFPTGSLKPVTVLGNTLANAWFDFHSFSDRTLNQESQIPGLSSSLSYLKQLIKKEVEVLDGKGKVIVGGFSQGCAMSGMVLVSGVLEELGVRAWVGMSGWLPFRREMEGVLEGGGEVGGYIRELLGGDEGEEVGNEKMEGEKEGGGRKLKVWMGHGENDTKMRVEWGREMREVLLRMGYEVDWKSYDGLEHSYSGEEISDLVLFLRDMW